MTCSSRAWSIRTVEDDPGAPFFNDTTKYVVSGTWRPDLESLEARIGLYDPDTIRRLKEEVKGDSYVSGSITLVRAMLADGLVDELHLCVYPLTRSGPRLFTEDVTPSQTVPGGGRVIRQRRALPELSNVTNLDPDISIASSVREWPTILRRLYLWVPVAAASRRTSSIRSGTSNSKTMILTIAATGRASRAP